MRTATLHSLFVLSTIALFSPQLAIGAESQGDETEIQQATPATDEAAQSDWVRLYLAEQLHYNEEQIQEFKANVADMPDEQLETLLKRLKFTATANVPERVVRDTAYNANLQRLNVARAEAWSRGTPRAPGMTYGYQNRRNYSSWYHAPGNYGLFRGYSVLIW